MNPQDVVGRAFRCSDGLIRWVTHLSTRNYYSVLWRYESDDVWHSGGIVKADKWEGGVGVAPPQPGETYKQAGATGVISERTMPHRFQSMHGTDSCWHCDSDMGQHEIV